eukprot:5776863-Prymnesium_polylepis.1
MPPPNTVHTPHRTPQRGRARGRHDHHEWPMAEKSVGDRFDHVSGHEMPDADLAGPRGSRSRRRRRGSELGKVGRVTRVTRRRERKRNTAGASRSS